MPGRLDLQMRTTYNRICKARQLNKCPDSNSQGGIYGWSTGRHQSPRIRQQNPIVKTIGSKNSQKLRTLSFQLCIRGFLQEASQQVAASSPSMRIRGRMPSTAHSEIPVYLIRHLIVKHDTGLGFKAGPFLKTICEKIYPESPYMCSYRFSLGINTLSSRRSKNLDSCLAGWVKCLNSFVFLTYITLLIVQQYISRPLTFFLDISYPRSCNEQGKPGFQNKWQNASTSMPTVFPNWSTRTPPWYLIIVLANHRKVGSIAHIKRRIGDHISKAVGDPMVHQSQYQKQKVACPITNPNKMPTSKTQVLNKSLVL